VRSESFDRQDVQLLAGLSCKRELYACFFLPLIEARLQHFPELEIRAGGGNRVPIQTICQALAKGIRYPRVRV
jgi:hypothetical protein